MPQKRRCASGVLIGRASRPNTVVVVAPVPWTKRRTPVDCKLRAAAATPRPCSRSRRNDLIMRIFALLLLGEKRQRIALCRRTWSLVMAPFRSTFRLRTRMSTGVGHTVPPRHYQQTTSIHLHLRRRLSLSRRLLEVHLFLDKSQAEQAHLLQN